MAKPKITNIHVDAHNGVSVHWDANGCRFHYWAKDDILTPRDDVFYKNPALSIEYNGEGYFPTRRLKISKNVNLIAGIRATALNGNMLQAAHEEAERREQNRIKEAEESYKKDVLDTVRKFAANTGEPIEMTDAELFAALKRVFATAEKARQG
jgi:hypothetical protein